MRCQSAVLMVVTVFAAASCSPDRPRLDPAGPGSDAFTLGPQTVYPIGSPGEIVVADSISGGEFVLPEGGSGTLTVARILASEVPPPEDADGFFAEYTGDEPLLYREARRPDAMLVLWALGKPDCSTSTPPSSIGDWLPIMPTDTLSDPVVFELTQPGYPFDAAALRSGAGAAPTAPEFAESTPGGRAAARPPHSYHFMRKHIPANGLIQLNMGSIRSIATWTMNDLIAALPTTQQLQQIVQGRYQGSHALEGWQALPSPGVSAYAGFRWWARRTIRETRPYFTFVATGPSRANEATIAHECGHYLTHLMLDDNLFEQIEGQRLAVHNFGDVHRDRPMLEEYAQFADYYKNGSVQSSFYVEEPIREFRKLNAAADPAVLDWPGQEGYPTCLLVRLTLATATIQGLSGTSEDIPVIGATATDIFGILGNGKPMNANALRAEIQSFLAGRGRDDAFPAILERTGWSYHGTGRVLDAQNQPVQGAKVQAVCKVPSEGGREYLAPPSPVTTNNRGEFSIPRLFPGTTLLRVTVNSTPRDFPVTVDANGATDATLPIPDLKLTESAYDRFRLWISARRSWTTIFEPENTSYGPLDDMIDTWWFHEKYLPGLEVGESGFTVDYDSTWTDQYGLTYRFKLGMNGTFAPGGSSIASCAVAMRIEDIGEFSRTVRDVSFNLNDIPLSYEEGEPNYIKSYGLTGAACAGGLLDTEEVLILYDNDWKEWGKYVLDEFEWEPDVSYLPRILVTFKK